ncbi:MAG: lactonase family protein [Spirochaetia bacterium]
MRVYVGTYTDPILFGTGEIFQGKGEGIYCYDLDTVTGQLRLSGTTTGVANPSYLGLDPAQRYLYAVNELKTFENAPTGTVSAFSVDAATGALTFLNRRPTSGTDPCHVVLSKDGRLVFVTNYMSGSVSVFPVAGDGSLEAASDFIQHNGSSVDPKRQEGPHAHSTVLDAESRFALVPDLGMDKVMIYRVDRDRGKLSANSSPWARARPGAGPRHLVFHPGGAFVYLINELDSTIVAFSFDAEYGALRELQSVPALPGDFHGASSCAGLQVTPAGTFLYGSNRGHDSIVIYRIDPATGRLAYVAHESTRGKNPRSFAIDPTGAFLIAANQSSDSLVTYRMDGKTGRLAATGTIVDVPTPVCVTILVP